MTFKMFSGGLSAENKRLLREIVSAIPVEFIFALDSLSEKTHEDNNYIFSIQFCGGP